jgi:hypothetical protein
LIVHVDKPAPVTEKLLRVGPTTFGAVVVDGVMVVVVALVVEGAPDPPPIEVDVAAPGGDTCGTDEVVALVAEGEPSDVLVVDAVDDVVGPWVRTVVVVDCFGRPSTCTFREWAGEATAATAITATISDASDAAPRCASCRRRYRSCTYASTMSASRVGRAVGSFRSSMVQSLNSRLSWSRHREHLDLTVPSAITSRSATSFTEMLCKTRRSRIS